MQIDIHVHVMLKALHVYNMHNNHMSKTVIFDTCSSMHVCMSHLSAIFKIKIISCIFLFTWYIIGEKILTV